MEKDLLMNEQNENNIIIKKVQKKGKADKTYTFDERKIEEVCK